MIPFVSFSFNPNLAKKLDTYARFLDIILFSNHLFNE